MLFKKSKKGTRKTKISIEDLKWNKMWDLWCNEEIEPPYRELMDYLSGVNNGGHHCHLDNVSDNTDLKEYIDALKSILPEPLKSNVIRAYSAYIKNPDDLRDEDVKILEECDDVYYDNEEMINKILKDRANKIIDL